MRSNQQRGVILLPVMLTISMVALVAFLVSRENATTLQINASQLERDQAEYLLETAYQHAIWQLAQKTTCTGYGNLASQSFAEHSYSANYTPASGSPISVVASVTLSNGNSLSKSFSIPVYSTPAQTTLQAPGTSVEDSYLELDNNGSVFSGDDKLKVQNLGGAVNYSIIRFDLSSLRDKPLKIKQAQLQLLLTSNSVTASIGVHPVTTYWDNDFVSWDKRASTLLWLQAGGDFDVSALDATIVTPTLRWYSWDVSSVVRDWLEGRLANQGLLLKPESTSNVMDFHSSDAGQDSDHPRLVIDYACECGQTCPGL